jgi:Fe-Mn family superoxide dismutase
VIDAKTMEIHYTKHAAAYAKNYRDAVAEELKGQAAEPENVLAKVTAYSAKIRNNGGGHYNHELFWKCMQPAAEQQPSEKLMSALQAGFGSLDGFKSKFKEAAMARFGSGWAWLYLDAGKKLQIGSTPNQDNPLMDASTIKGVPLLGLDVWEHAYYLKYQNRRAEYIDNWFRLINWTYVEKRFESA